LSWPDWSAWGDAVALPVQERIAKPRRVGRTMVIDKGIGLRELRDMLEVCAPFIDYIKLAFGTSVLYRPEILQRKVLAIRNFDVNVYPGGTLFELACAQGKAEAFVARAKEIGFTCLEVSDGTFEVSQSERRRRIDLGIEAGLSVITEVGKKDKRASVVAEKILHQLDLDLAWGADMAIVEGRDSGLGVGVYDDDGSPKNDVIEDVLSALHSPSASCGRRRSRHSSSFGSAGSALASTLETCRRRTSSPLKRRGLPSEGIRSKTMQSVG